MLLSVLIVRIADSTDYTDDADCYPDAAISIQRCLNQDTQNLVHLGKKYGNNYDRKDFDEYLKFSTLWLTEARRILKPTGTIYVFRGFRFISYLYDILDRELRMYFNSWICWHYTQGMGRTKGFSPRHDDILRNFLQEETDNMKTIQPYAASWRGEAQQGRVSVNL